MFGIGSSELLVILLVALLVLGPSQLPRIAKTLGKAMGEFRRVSTDFQRTLNLEAEKEEHEERKRQAEKEFFPEPGKPETSADASVASAQSEAENAPRSDLDKAVDAVGREARSKESA